LFWGVGKANEDEIDEINILQATMLAMQRAVKALGATPDFCLIDGNCMPRLPCPGRAVIGGDGLVASIAAASIIAKVTRDRIMCGFDALYPQYGFARHKGYPTKAHYLAIEQFGTTPCHRRSFLKGRK
jgi:ribonuclease HII